MSPSYQTEYLKKYEILFPDISGQDDITVKYEGNGKITGTTRLPKTMIRMRVNGQPKTVILTDENGMFTYKNSKLAKGDMVQIEMKIDGIYTAVKEILIVGLSGNELILQPVSTQDKKSSRAHRFARYGASY